MCNIKGVITLALCPCKPHFLLPQPCTATPHGAAVSHPACLHTRALWGRVAWETLGGATRINNSAHPSTYTHTTHQDLLSYRNNCVQEYVEYVAAGTEQKGIFGWDQARDTIWGESLVLLAERNTRYDAKMFYNFSP